MQWLASQSCVCCSLVHGITTRPVQLHHVRVWGLPRRTNNPLRTYTVIPLCDPHHQSGPDAVHVVGEQVFVQRLGIGLDELLMEQYRRYAETRWVNIPRELSTLEVAEWLCSRSEPI